MMLSADLRVVMMISLLGRKCICRLLCEFSYWPRV